MVGASGSALRERFLARVAPLLDRVGAAAPAVELDGFDERRRRRGGGGPDPEVVARVRGDRNREFLLD